MYRTGPHLLSASAGSEPYTLSLHDALPILRGRLALAEGHNAGALGSFAIGLASLKRTKNHWSTRSEEHTSELQSRGQLVCRLLIEKKNTPIAASPPILPTARTAYQSPPRPS